MPVGAPHLESRFARVGGLRVHTRAADGPRPVVGVHGLGVSTRHLEPLLRTLARRRGVRAPDLPGFGRSERPPRPLSVEELAAFLERWLDAERLRRVPLVANSLGCQVAVELALRAPERVTALVLVGPTFDPAAPTLLRQAARLLVDSTREPIRLNAVVATDYLRAGPLRTVAAARLGLAHPIAERLAGVTAPTLVVRGARDPIVPLRWGERAAQLLPRGRLAVVPHAAHAAHFSYPERVLELALPFLDEERREAAAR